MGKTFLDIDVLTAARQRLARIYRDFDRVYVSFSAGKDSGVLLNLAIEAAREAGKLPVHVLYIDLEAQYKATVEYAERELMRPEVRPYWICLPLNLRNAVSQIQPNWTCWDADAKDLWVRPMPDHACVIDEAKAAELGWMWFKKGLEFERFIIDFAYWFSGQEKTNTCTLVGIRADESLNRYLAVGRDDIETKDRWQELNWTTQIRKSLYNAYPLYDWRVEDIWIANGRLGFDYNGIYDLFYKAGVPMKDARICQPYGDDQRKGLYLFKLLEHETWCKVVNRVHGANYGQKYVHDEAMADRAQFKLPPGHTYQSYAEFLLTTMPEHLASGYREKIGKFIKWWNEEGVKEIPDYADPRLETKKKAPSWRRICKMILKNDMYGKSLSFALTKADKQRQYEMIMRYTDL